LTQYLVSTINKNRESANGALFRMLSLFSGDNAVLEHDHFISLHWNNLC